MKKVQRKTKKNSSEFAGRVFAIVKKIPKGKILTYKEVARRAGNTGAARAVGNILNKNKDKNIPCHRVIRSEGKIGGYNGLRGNKKKLLQTETNSSSVFVYN